MFEELKKNQDIQNEPLEGPEVPLTMSQTNKMVETFKTKRSLTSAKKLVYLADKPDRYTRQGSYFYIKS